MIWQNLTNPGRFANLTDKEVRRLAIVYTYANHGDPYELVGVIPASQQARYLAVAREIAGAPVPLRPVRPIGDLPRPRMKVASAPMPNVGMTLEEIYLEFRTAQIGSLGVAGALYETVAFAGWNLGKAWALGQAAGYPVSYLLQTYAPATMDALVGQNMMLLIDGKESFVPDQWTALLLTQDAAGYGLGDFGVGNDVYLGPALPWETPTPIPTDPTTGWSAGGGNPGYNNQPSTPPSPPQGAPGVPDSHGTITIEPINQGFQSNPHGYPGDICEDIAWSSYNGAHC